MAETIANVVALPQRSAFDREPLALSLVGVNLEIAGQKLLQEMTIHLPLTGVSVIMGPNGAGKSLLLRLLAGLIEPASGSIQVHSELKDRIALVFQRPVLLRRAVQANLSHALRVHKVPRNRRRRRLQELLRMGGLTALADQPARRLSGGEQQRLAMVRAMAANPRLLLLDEPTASLDPQSTAMIETLIQGASIETKILLVTHDRDQAQRLADDVVFVHRGRAVEHSKAAQFFNRPASEQAQAYLEGRLLL